MNKRIGTMMAAVMLATIGFGSAATAQVMTLKRPSLAMSKPPRLPPTSKKPEPAKPAPATKRVFTLLCVGAEKTVSFAGLGKGAPYLTLMQKLERGGVAGSLTTAIVFKPENIRGVSAPVFTKDDSGEPMACVTLEVEVAK